MEALGRHSIVEFYDCTFEALCDHAVLEQQMVTAAEKSGATVVSSNFHTFNPYGVSGVVVIAESHLTIHTWPEHNYAAVDIFTCGSTLEASHAIDYLTSVLGSSRVTTEELKRGIALGVAQHP
ncbi:MAG: adenosylmethionine decarboxylase [Fibrobacterales bacterium]